MLRVQIVMVGIIGVLLALPVQALTDSVASSVPADGQLSFDTTTDARHSATRLAKKKKRKKRRKKSSKQKKKTAEKEDSPKEPAQETEKAATAEAEAPKETPASATAAASEGTTTESIPATPTPAPAPAPAAANASPTTTNGEEANKRVEAKGLDARVRRLTDALARSLKRLPSMT